MNEEIQNSTTNNAQNLLKSFLITARYNQRNSDKEGLKNFSNNNI